MDFLSLFGSGRLARSNGPDRFISNDDASHLLLTDIFEPSWHLPLNHSKGLPPFPLLQGLPDTEDHFKPLAESGPYFSVHCLICLSKKLTPLRVAEDPIMAAHPFEHRRGDLPGKRP